MIKILIMDKSLEQLKILVEVSRSRNFREAAQALQLSQASVTNNLRTLEEQFESPLFVLEGKKKVLTPFGKAISEIATRNLKKFDFEISEAEKLYSDTSLIPLKVGCRPEVFSYVAAKVPEGISCEHIAMSGPEVTPKLLGGDVDFGFSTVVPDSLQVIAKKAFPSHVSIAVHKSFLKRNKEDLWKDREFLQTVPSLAYEKNGHLLQELADSVNLEHGNLKIRMTVDSWNVLASLVEQKLGYAILPNYVATSDDIVRQVIPAKVIRPLDFYILMRTAYKDVPVFKSLLKTDWSI